MRSLPQLASAVPTLNPQGILRIRRIRELEFKVPEFVDRTRGSQHANFGGGLGEREANAEPPPAGRSVSRLSSNFYIERNCFNRYLFEQSRLGVL